MTQYSGLCIGGPLSGKSYTHRNTMLRLPQQPPLVQVGDFIAHDKTQALPDHVYFHTELIKPHSVWIYQDPKLDARENLIQATEALLNHYQKAVDKVYPST